MLSYIFDIIIVLLLIFFAWRGAKKGLILTLFSLLALFVAFFGAKFLSNQFYEPVGELIQPAIHESLTGTESGQDTDISTEDLLDIVRDSKLFSGFSGAVEDAVNDGTIEETEHRTASEAVAHYLSGLIAKVVLFAAAFLLILLIWFLLSHLLNFTFRLPILSAINRVGGLVLGLVKGALLVIVLVWIGQLTGVVPTEPETPILSLFTVRQVLELLNNLVV